MADIAFDAMLDTGILVQPFPIERGDWENMDRSANRLQLQTIAREGCPL